MLERSKPMLKELGKWVLLVLVCAWLADNCIPGMVDSPYNQF